MTLSGDFSVFFIFDFEVFETFEFSLFRVFSGLFVENPNSKSTYNIIVYLELFHQAYLLSIDMSVIFCTKIDLLLSSLFVNHWSECWLIKFISTIKVNILNIIYCFCEPKIILLDFQLNYLDWYFWIIVSIRIRLDLSDLDYDKKVILLWFNLFEISESLFWRYWFCFPALNEFIILFLSPIFYIFEINKNTCLFGLFPVDVRITPVLFWSFDLICNKLTWLCS